MPAGHQEKKSRGLLRLAGVCGFLGATLPLVMIVSAAFLSYWFRWDTNALSDLGVREEFWLFNSAVMIGGVLNFLFAIGLHGYLSKERLTKAGIEFPMSAIKESS